MFRICCLFGDETKDTVSKEIIYHRYFRFYLLSHCIFLLIQLLEFFVFLDEPFAVLYFLCVGFLTIDAVGYAFVEFKPQPGPSKRCIYFFLFNSFVTLFLYTAAKLDAFVDPTMTTGYVMVLILLLMIFIPTKSRSIYHIFKFTQYSAEEKNAFYLSMQDPIDLSANNRLGTYVPGSIGPSYHRMTEESHPMPSRSNTHSQSIQPSLPDMKRGSNLLRERGSALESGIQIDRNDVLKASVAGSIMASVREEHSTERRYSDSLQSVTLRDGSLTGGGATQETALPLPPTHHQSVVLDEFGDPLVGDLDFASMFQSVQHLSVVEIDPNTDA